MKSFALVSALTAFVAADRAGTPGTTATRSFQEGAGRNGTSGQMARFSAGSTKNILNTATSVTERTINWSITAWTVFYEDSGTTRIRLMHNLTANIFATDTVNFEIAFRPENMQAPTSNAAIGEDYVTCDMSQSSTDGYYWAASVAEGYYICDGADAANVCLYITDDANYEQKPESTSDWVTPYSDDEPDDAWCTHTNTVIGDALSPFECSAIQCVIERDLDTGNTVEDFRFTPGTATGEEDYLVIAPGRAKLYINKTLGNFQTGSENVGNTNTEGWKLTVGTGATGLLVSALSAATVTLAALAF